MIINEELFELEEKCNLVAEQILNSTAMAEFKEAKTALAKSAASQAKIEAFQKAKENFEEIERFGKFIPEYVSLRQSLFTAKREMDLDEEVYQFRAAERNLQVQLDLIAKQIAASVSENILVSAGDPFSFSMIGLPAACEIHLGKRKESEL